MARLILRKLYALWQRFRFRYDVFLSYARTDGTEYAKTLKRQLEQLDFTCFLDTDDLAAGDVLTAALRKALSRSARLVVVGSPGSTVSKYVAIEVAEFEKTGRGVIPIEFGGSLAAATWLVLEERDLVWIDDSTEALGRGIPSVHVAKSIDTAFEHRKRNAMVRLQTALIAAAFVIGAAVAVVVIRNAAAESRRASDLAKAERGRADEAIRESLTQQALAQSAIDRADEEKKRAAAATQEAQRQSAIAAANVALAKERLIDVSQEQGRLELLRGRGQQALIYLRDAYEKRPGDESLRFLVRAASRTIVPVLGGHEGSVHHTSWSPSGEKLLTIDHEDARLWTSAGNLVRTLRRPDQSVDTAAAWFVRAGKEIVTVDDRIRFWSAEGRWLRDLAIDTRGRPLQLTKDERWLLVDIDTAIRVIDLSAEKILHDIPAAPGKFFLRQRASVDDAGEKVAVVGDDDGTVRIYDLRDLTQKPRELHEKEQRLSFVRWTPNGRHLLVVPDTSEAVIWDVTSGSVASRLGQHRQGIRAAEFSPDSRYLVTGSSDETVLWELAPGEVSSPRATLLAERGGAGCVAFSHDSRRLLTGCGLFDKDARLWDVRAAALQTTLSGHQKELLTLSFSADGGRVVTGR